MTYRFLLISQVPYETDDSYVSFRSDEDSWCPPEDILERDQWILMKVDRMGGPNFNILVSRFRK